MKTRKTFDINRLREFCKLINEGSAPAQALAKLNACIAYATPLKASGIYWREKDGTYKAVERIRSERYDLFLAERKKYNKRNWDRQVQKKNELKNKKVKIDVNKVIKVQPKYIKKSQLNFVQRVVKSLFNL
jgi:hypothetical protein